MSAEDRREDALRAREAALRMFARGINLDQSRAQVDTWTKLLRMLDQPELDPSKVRDLDASIHNFLISNNLFCTAIAMHVAIADKASYHEQTKTAQESSTARQTSVLLEPLELLKDSLQRPGVTTHPIHQTGEGSRASGKKWHGPGLHLHPDDQKMLMALDSSFELDAIMPMLHPPRPPSSPPRHDTAARHRNMPKPKASMATRAKEYAAKVFRRLGRQRNTPKVEGTGNKAERSANLFVDDTQPLISSSTRAVSGEPVPKLPNEKKRYNGQPLTSKQIVSWREPETEEQNTTNHPAACYKAWEVIGL